MAKLFGTSGTRGKTNVEITPMLAFRIALCYGHGARPYRIRARPFADRVCDDGGGPSLRDKCAGEDF